MVIELKVEAAYTGGDYPFYGVWIFSYYRNLIDFFFLTEFPLWFSNEI